MKVILLQDVKKKGKKDDILEVSDGYAKNFLIKNKLAVPYTKGSEKVLNAELAKRQSDEEQLIKEMEQVKQKLEKQKFIFNVQTGNEDKVFGTISSKQIRSALVEKGFGNVSKKEIVIETPINSIGVYQVKMILHKKVHATLWVELRKK